MDARLAVLVLAVLLMVSWAIGWFAGGEDAVPPHWYYIPIALAAVRFGPFGAFVTAVISTVLAGPLLPSDVATMTPQPLSDWTIRGAFFIAVGQVFALAARQPEGARALARRVTRLDRELRRAMANGELEVQFQGIFDIGGRRQRVNGAEALLRWRHPGGVDITPSEFVPLAEQSGLILELGDLVCAEVCRRVAAWRDLVGDPFVVAMNLSARQLGDPNLAARVRTCIETADVDASLLCFEVTETAAMADISASRDQLQALRELGAKIAIDDFGTGHSALAYAHLLPVDTIKIDQSFVARITEESEAAAIVRNIILLAHALGFSALAEGVETAEQLALLKSMHCDEAQGFFLHRPAPPDELTAALQLQRRRTQRRQRTERAASRRSA
jgi:EAL domain-containing protein (putative c-di-GMP-specific phosphodiesterase class I)